VPRPRLTERLNEGLHRRLTLISAPAGFGKTTLLSQWLAGCARPVAWISLADSENDLTHFLAYLVAAIQTVAPAVGPGLPVTLRSPQPPPAEAILAALLNDIAVLEQPLVLVLDDYHVITSRSVDQALGFLLTHLPPQLHLVIATRETPRLPLARLRARGQLTELRAADVRFTSDEAAGFLNRTMGLDLAEEEIAALARRTEGWVAGLQFAALSLQGQQDAAGVIASFSGSHRFVLDYLLEEVLNQQPAHIQRFVLHTAILDRLCGPLCDAILRDAGRGMRDEDRPSSLILHELERANLFLVPLDDERRWYRYHQLFADLLRQRLPQSLGSTAELFALHERASIWFEQHGLALEAFHHAVAAGDVARAERLVETGGMLLDVRGAVAPILGWLESLPRTTLDARPALWVMRASALLLAGNVAAIEPTLRDAEHALAGVESDDRTRDLEGRVAAMRAMLAIVQYDITGIMTQSRRALAHLRPDNLAARTSATWTLGYAHQLQGDRAAAKQAYTAILASDRAAGETIYTIAAISSLGQIQEADNALHLATATYQRVLEIVGDPPHLIAGEAFLGLARIAYQRNDLRAAQQRGQQCRQLARQIESIDTLVACEVLLARLLLAHDDVAGAAAMLGAAEARAHQHHFTHLLAEIAAAQVSALLHQGNLAAAAQLAQAHKLLLSQARVQLAQGNTAAALATIEAVRREAEARDWRDERLKALVLQAVALRAHGAMDMALRTLGEALALAQPEGIVRIFVDEGAMMAELLTRMLESSGGMHAYLRTLLAACAEHANPQSAPFIPQPLIEPLSQRELEVLKLIAQGLSNRQIGERLFLAVSTVKGHNQVIFDKLQARRRTEAVVRARELGLL
jgi:LuxR family maltose regulon positive regulatory protein